MRRRRRAPEARTDLPVPARPWRRPAVAVLLLAPFLGEVLSTSTAPLALLVPWILALQVALYGCGALLCRELARRWGVGRPGLLLLAGAYAVYEEALVTGFWFDAGYQDEVGVGAYSRVWGTNLLLAAHLTAFHVAVSVCSSVLLVERLFPACRERAWAGPRGLLAAAVGLFVVVPLGFGDSLSGPVPQSVAAGGLAVLLVVGAAVLTRRPPPAPRPRRRRPRFVGTIAFAGAGASFLLTYTVPATGWPWPVGTALALAPVAAAVLLVRPMTATGDADGPVGLRVVVGMLSFFVVLDALVGLAGRYDLTAGALLTAYALHRLSRTDRPWWERAHRRSRRPRGRVPVGRRVRPVRPPPTEAGRDPG